MASEPLPPRRRMKHHLKIDTWGVVVIGFLGAILMLMALLSLFLDQS